MAQYELNLRDYFRIINRRKFIIFVVFLAAVTGTIIHLSNQIPTYEAYTTVKFVERKSESSIMMEMMAYDPADALASQERVIQSFPVLMEAAKRMNLITPASSPAEINDAVQNLQGMIETGRIERTSIIKIIAYSENPKEAMDLANLVAQVYVEKNLEEKTNLVRSQRDFIEGQLARLEEKTRLNEEKLKAFQEEDSNIGLADPIQKKLIDMEFQLASLLQKYTENHPAVIQMKDQIADLKAQIKKFSGQETAYTRTLRELEVDQKLYAMLKEKLEEARIGEAQKSADVTILDPASMPPLKTIPYRTGGLIGGMMGLLLGIVIAFLAETMDTSIATIEDVENVIKLPVLAVIPSIAPAGKRRTNLFKKIYKKVFRIESDLEEEIYARLIVHHSPKSPVSEAYRNLRTNLKLGPANKTFLFTSSGPREGKSTVLINIGLTIAQRGEKVLLVSSDMRRPVVEKSFGIKREPGLNEVLNGALKLEDVIRGVSDIMLGEMSYDEIVKSPAMANVYILPCGSLPQNPAEILSSKKMQEVMDEVKAKFDYILYDAPPILPVTDASILCSRVDSVILCYEIGRTARAALLRSKNQLETSGAHVIGIVLNHINPQTEEIEQYPYSYAYKYGYYYGEENPEKALAEEEKREADAKKSQH